MPSPARNSIFIIASLIGLLTPPGASEIDTEASAIHRLEGPEDQIRGIRELCPLRLELPLTLEKRKIRVKTEKAREAHCNGVYIKVLKLNGERGRWSQASQTLFPSKSAYKLSANADVWLPKGEDLKVILRYSLVQGEREIMAASETLQADENELNWGSAVDLWFEKEEDRPDALRVDVTLEKR